MNNNEGAKKPSLSLSAKQKAGELMQKWIAKGYITDGAAAGLICIDLIWAFAQLQQEEQEK